MTTPTPARLTAMAQPPDYAAGRTISESEAGFIYDLATTYARRHVRLNRLKTKNSTANGSYGQFNRIQIGSYNR